MAPVITENAGLANAPGLVQLLIAYSPLFLDLLLPLALALAGYGLTLLQKHGYRTAYAAAILRAMGAGIQAAMDAKLDPLSPAGRAVVVKTGAGYLAEKVGSAAKALGINTIEQHAERVDAQLGTVIAAGIASGSIVPPQAGEVLQSVLTEISGQPTLPNLSILGRH